MQQLGGLELVSCSQFRPLGLIDTTMRCMHFVHVTIPLQVEQQGAQLESFQQKNLLLQEENNVLKERILNMERYRCRNISLKNSDQEKSLLSQNALITYNKKHYSNWSLLIILGSWRTYRQKTQGFLKLSPQRKPMSNIFNSSWRRRPGSAASCPDSCNKLWTTHRDRC